MTARGIWLGAVRKRRPQPNEACPAARRPSAKNNARSRAVAGEQLQQADMVPWVVPSSDPGTTRTLDGMGLRCGHEGDALEPAVERYCAGICLHRAAPTSTTRSSKFSSNQLHMLSTCTSGQAEEVSTLRIMASKSTNTKQIWKSTTYYILTN